MLTVMLATLNRADLLSEVLGAFSRLDAPDAGWTLVICDNGSTDRTREVVDAFRARLPIDYVFAPEPGKNAALNAGLARIRGDLVVLTDDDVFPHRDWLIRMSEAARTHADYAIFAGRVAPRWAEPPQAWLQEWVPGGPTFSITDPAFCEGPCGVDRVFGPNMAVRASVFAAGTTFDAGIGPRGEQYAMGSETELVTRLLERGYKAWFVAGSTVEHFIRKAQMQRSWVLRRARRFGRGQYRLTHVEASAAKTFAGVPRYLVRQMASQVWRVGRAAVVGDARAGFEAQWELNYLAGQMIEARVSCRNESRRSGRDSER
jgi:L-malate glycosyltransferase